MDLLFVQPFFPGQYRHIVRHLAARGGHRIVFLHDAGVPPGRPIPGVTTVTYGPIPAGPPDTGPSEPFTHAVRRAEAVRAAAEGLKARGFSPSTVAAHTGHGDSLFLKSVFPAARLVGFFEYFHSPRNPVLGFDPEAGPVTDALRHRAQVRGAVSLMALEAADAGVTPTHWQHGLYPPAWRSRLAVIHDGIDTDRIRPDPAARTTLPDGTRLAKGDPVVTFCGRGLERLRGLHTFLRALPAVFRAHRSVRVVIAGHARTHYGAAPPPDRPSDLQALLAEGGDGLDRDRLHPCGWLERDALTALLQVSACHVYLTAPFVLSWSLLEAMAAGAPVIASDTAPVREVIADGTTGVLTDFFAPDLLARRILAVLARPDAARTARARRLIEERYALDVCLPRHLHLLEVA
jgi:glycosyltransferase involved in cell wall biosynthesis